MATRPGKRQQKAYKKLLKMFIEILDLPSYKMVIFHRFLYVYQKVSLIPIIFPPDSHHIPMIFHRFFDVFCMFTRGYPVFPGAVVILTVPKGIRGHQIMEKMMRSYEIHSFRQLLPSGKHTKNYGKSPFYSWENPLFQWPFSIAILT